MGAMTVGELVERLIEAFPLAWAEPWDRCGLLVGDGLEPVVRAFITLDASIETLQMAREHGANVLITHHPPFLETFDRVTNGTAAGRLVLEAARASVSVISMHTNLDRSPAGARALVRALGYPDGQPLERGVEEADLVTVFVPPDAAAAVIDAMTASGAGRIGEYEGCAFQATGAGTFQPRAGASPAVDVQPGGSIAEARVEMVAPRGQGGRVAVAASRVHPYEEPLIVVSAIRIARGAARLGRIVPLSGTLADVAQRASERLRCPVRVWGSPDTTVTLLAIANGSGGSLIDDALAAGAEVLLAGEVRYHDATRAVSSGLAVIEAGHDVTEWPLVAVLAEQVVSLLGTERVVVDAPRVGWRVHGRME